MRTTRILLFPCVLALAAACGSSDSNRTTSINANGAAPGGGTAGSATPGSPNSSASSADVTADGGVATNPDGTPRGPARPYVDFDVNHILVTGQSNAVSNNGRPVLSTTQPFGNISFNTGVMPGRGWLSYPDSIPCGGEGCIKYDTPSSFVPLVEGDEFFDYPVETSAAGMANQISFLATTKYKGTIPGLPDHHDILVSNHGRSGNTYWCLRKGGCPYKPGYNKAFDQGMEEVQSGMQLAGALGKSYVVRAVAVIHGESDHYSYTGGLQEFPNSGSDGTPGKIQNYADALLEWQSDYETSVQAITHQTQPIPMFVSQLSGWNDAHTSKVAQFQLDAHIRAPGKVILIGPAYSLELGQVDCLHYTSEGERHLGEYFAKVYARVVLEGGTWEPVRPKTIARDGAVITIQYFVPVPPLVIDTDKVASVAGNGFEWVDSSGASPAVSKVEITGPDTVVVTLSAAPATTDGHLTYAQNQTVGTCIGSPFGARGNIRDSDATPSQIGYPLQNWGVTFDIAVP
jgi:hypothetical protein